MTTDELISMAKACENVIEADLIDELSPEVKIVILRESIKTLAVVQRDLIRGLLGPGV